MQAKFKVKAFLCKESSNVSFNQITIGTRKGYEDGVEISDVVLSNNFEKNINGVVNNDSGKEE